MIKIALFAVLCFAAAALAAPPQAEYDVSLFGFHSWMSHHGKEYATNEEKALRYRVWSEAMTRILDHNAAAEQGVHTYTMGMNEFGDLTWTEFQHMYLGTRVTPEKLAEHQAHERQHLASGNVQLPSSVDWRTKNAVTHVKNQGQCGSCWSFSTTGSTEGQWFLAGHDLVSLSEQELVSCDTRDDGCNGGLMSNAWTTIVDNWDGLITGEADYPYVSGDGQVPACNRAGKPARAKITGQVAVAHSESEMATAVSNVGPVSIGVDASTWQTYTGGIMTNCASTQVDHGVLIVGYDLSYTTPYWIIKNSWTAQWGEEGYIRVEYGKDQCLITTV